MTDGSTTGACVSCQVRLDSTTLDSSTFTCTGCRRTLSMCEFCDDTAGTNLYTCPYCDHTALLPRTTLRLLSLPVIDRLCYHLSRRKLHRLNRDESTVEEILETTERFRGYGLYRHLTTLQKRSELVPLVDALADHDPDTVLEIGTGRGGTLYIWCRALDPDRAISLDLPGGPFGGGYPARKIKFFDAFCRDTDLTCIRRDAHDEHTADLVRRALDGVDVDFLFIDGDHTYEGVKRDFELYSTLVGTGGLVALHDIAHPQNDDPESGYGVKRFWSALEREYDTTEFVAPGDHQYGIGLVHL